MGIDLRQLIEEQERTLAAANPWFWEGNVQATLVRWMAGGGYEILRQANTASREPGQDIIARRDDQEIWVSVKGYPEDKLEKRTKPPTQARHWFKDVVFDLVEYRSRNCEVSVAIALPAGFETYSNLLGKVSWLCEHLDFTVFWIAQDGSVREQAFGPRLRAPS